MNDEPDFERPSSVPKEGMIEPFDAGWNAHKTGLGRKTVEVLSKDKVWALLGWDTRALLERAAELSTPETPEDPDGLFVVRLYDGMDNEWMDVSGPVSQSEADRIWNEYTENGTEKTKYEDIDYYKVFPTDTIMRLSEEGRKFRERGSR